MKNIKQVQHHYSLKNSKIVFNFNNSIKNMKQMFFIAYLLLFTLFSSQAATLPNASVDVADTTAGATTTYTIQFDTVGTLDTSGLLADGIVFASNTGGANLENSMLQSLSGGSITGAITGSSLNSITITLSGGTASPGTAITIVLSNVVNPGLAGMGPDYSILHADFVVLPPNVDEAIVSGTLYTNSNLPTVTLPIADQSIIQENGNVIVVSDLNTVFTDGDGDNLSFTVDAGNNVNIATASIVGDQLTVVPTGSGVTNITIRASDLPSGTGEGEVTDTFQVTVIGEFTNASVTPSVLDSGATASYSISFNPASTITTNQVLIVSSANGGPDYSSATLASVSGGTLNLSIFSQSATGISFNIDSGTANSSQVITIQLNNMVNPGTAGLGPDYILRLFDLGLPGDVDQKTLAGSVFTAVGLPTITTPIVNQILNQIDGASIITADLNTVFIDGDGDTLTFSIVPGNDTSIATAIINGNQLTVTPVGSGTTSIMVKASDLLSGNGEGEVIDTFQVRVIGILENAVITPANLRTSANTSYSISFSPATTISTGHIIIVETNDILGPNFSNATLNSISGGDLSVNGIFSQTAQVISLQIASGTATSSNMITIQFDNIINPSIVGTGPIYQISVFDFVDGIIDFVTLSGSIYFSMEDIFTDSFEDIVFIKSQLAQLFIKSITLSNHSIIFSREIPIYNHINKSYIFLGQSLSLDDDNHQMRNYDEVIQWLESVLILKHPNQDWNNNGIKNAIDTNPFGVFILD